MYDFLPVLIFRFFLVKTSEEGRRTYRPKRCGNNNKDEDKSPQTLNDEKTYSHFKMILNQQGLTNIYLVP